MTNVEFIVPGLGDRKDTLRAASRARLHVRDRLGEQAQNAPLRGVHWLPGDRAYFDLNVPSIKEAEEALSDLEIDGQPVPSIAVQPAPAVYGDPCVNCGNIAGRSTPPVCPNCNFREISPCPNCKHDISRTEYIPVVGSVFKCPNCSDHVRLTYNEPMFDRNGDYRSPLILIERAEEGP